MFDNIKLALTQICSFIDPIALKKLKQKIDFSKPAKIFWKLYFTIKIIFLYYHAVQYWLFDWSYNILSQKRI